MTAKWGRAMARTIWSILARNLRPLFEGVAGCSPYLKGLMQKEAEWLRAAVFQPPETVVADELAALEGATTDSLSRDLRRAKRRIALLTALADLGGVWGLEQVTGAITDLADRAVDLSIRRLVADEIRRGKLPGQAPEDAATGAGMVALAMGKMGAAELNYSSDIDLICLFDQERAMAMIGPRRGRPLSGSRARWRPCCRTLPDEGYVFRTDLRLRPMRR
jgi:[glutamine synthetase] adenylyltransferase / [glutamine synthetase]-adenylyl-L-tyrosine phosphorylase